MLCLGKTLQEAYDTLLAVEAEILFSFIWAAAWHQTVYSCILCRESVRPRDIATDLISQ